MHVGLIPAAGVQQVRSPSHGQVVEPGALGKRHQGIVEVASRQHRLLQFEEGGKRRLLLGRVVAGDGFAHLGQTRRQRACNVTGPRSVQAPGQRAGPRREQAIERGGRLAKPGVHADVEWRRPR